MRTTDLIGTNRSPLFHVKASAVQPHAWYHEMFAGTLCGRWMRVESIVPDVPLDAFTDVGVEVCDTCLQKSRRFVR